MKARALVHRVGSGDDAGVESGEPYEFARLPIRGELIALDERTLVKVIGTVHTPNDDRYQAEIFTEATTLAEGVTKFKERS